MAPFPQKLQAFGTLADRVLLKSREELDGGKTVLVPVGTMWARVRSVTGGEGSHSVVIRYRSDVKEGDQLVYRGRPLEVVKCADLDGRRAYLVAYARELKS